MGDREDEGRCILLSILHGYYCIGDEVGGFYQKIYAF